MANPFFSIIIPVYNTEKYIERCINSILIQSFTDFELLLIDDGSADKSGEICDKFALNDSRIKVIHKTNGGVNSARKYGFDISCGEYIMFVDSDDELKSNALGLMYNLYCNKEFDLLITAESLIVNNVEYKLFNKVIGYISNEMYVKNLLKEHIFIGPYGRIIKRDLFINSDAFDIPNEIIINEDLIMNLKLGINARKIFITNDINSYNYYKNPNTASRRIMDLLYWIKVFDIIESVLNNYNLYTCRNIREAYYIFILNRIRQSTQEPYEIKNKYLSKVQKEHFINVNIIKNYLLLKYNFVLYIFLKLKKIFNI